MSRSKDYLIEATGGFLAGETPEAAQQRFKEIADLEKKYKAASGLKEAEQIRERLLDLKGMSLEDDD